MALTYQQYADARSKGDLLKSEAYGGDVVASKTFVSQEAKNVVYDLTVGLAAQYPEYEKQYQADQPVQTLSNAQVLALLDEEPPAEDRLSNEEYIRLHNQGYKSETEGENENPPPDSQDDASSWKQTQNSVLTAIGAPTQDQDVVPTEPESPWEAWARFYKDQKKAQGIVPQSNPLHAYASSTYAISLHMLSRDDFNKMASDPNSDWNPTTTLIAEGGKYGLTGFQRDPAWQEDFYFEDLKIESIVQSQAGNQASNSQTINFTIIEPYGMTLIDRLIDACIAKTTAEGQGLVDGKNYTEIPYLLQIDFYGYDDDGKIFQLRSQRKYIPISLGTMKIKVGVKGTEYQVESFLYSHKGFSQEINACPANFEVTASTLEEFFAPDVNVADLNKKLDERDEQYKKEKLKELAKQSTGTRSQTQDSAPSAAEATYEVRSFIAAYNAWQARTVENHNAQDYNTIRVVFDDEILANGGGKITAPKTENVKQVATADPKNPKHKSQVAKANAGQQTAKPNLNINKFTFKTGTGVVQIINAMMVNSEYIRRQVIDKTIDAEQNPNTFKKDVDWWKVTSSVKMRSFCTQTSKWYFDVTYYVKKKTVYNRTHPGLPTSLPTAVHKEYNYIYTGKNIDIIDFSIEYDALFYTAVSIDRNKQQAVTVTAGPDQSGNNTDNPNDVPPNPARAEGSPVQDRKQQNVAGQYGTQVTANATKDSKASTASSAADHVNNGLGADQLNVKLKIVGDPQFIKQDEVFSNPEARKLDPNDAAGIGHVGPPDGSIDMDSQEIHALLTWNTPVDIDEETGSIRKNGKYNQSVFSGIFQITTLTSTFSRGQFTQDLDMLRLTDQPRDYKNPDSKRSLDERTVEKTSPSVETAAPRDRFEAVTSNVVQEPAQSAMNQASQNWTPKQRAGDENSGALVDTQDTEVDSDPATGYVDQTNRSVLSAITGNPNTPVETPSADTFPPTQTPAEIISTSPAVQSSTSSPASSVVPDATPAPVGYGNTQNITDAQIQNSPIYTQTYNNNVALGVPPLLAAQQASQAARQAIALGN
jgi:hypothetical protein